jgi:hypothetical protein
MVYASFNESVTSQYNITGDFVRRNEISQQTFSSIHALQNPAIQIQNRGGNDVKPAHVPGLTPGLDLVLYNGDNLDSIVNDYKINKLNEHFTEFEKIKEEMKKNEINLEKVLTISGIEQTDEMVEFKKIIDVLKNRLIDSKSKCEDALEEYSIAKQKYTGFFDKFNTLYKSFDEEEEQDTEFFKKIDEKMKKEFNKLNIDTLCKKYTDAFKNYGIVLIQLKSITGTIIPTTSCQICLENQVEYFLDPCGHTLCGTCKDNCDKTNRTKCHYCREPRKSYKKLFL